MTSVFLYKNLYKNFLAPSLRLYAVLAVEDRSRSGNEGFEMQMGK